jgi:hypothetical protein
MHCESLGLWPKNHLSAANQRDCSASVAVANDGVSDLRIAALLLSHEPPLQFLNALLQ